MERHEISLANEVGLHASREALDAVLRVTGTLPQGPVRLIAVAVAFGYIQHKIDGLKLVHADKPEGLVFSTVFNAVVDATGADLMRDVAKALEEGRRRRKQEQG